MIPVECVILNYATGSLCRRLGVEERKGINPAYFRIIFQDDALGDPMVNESQAIALGWATAEQLEQMKAHLPSKRVLKNLFDRRWHATCGLQT